MINWLLFSVFPFVLCSIFTHVPPLKRWRARRFQNAGTGSQTVIWHSFHPLHKQALNIRGPATAGLLLRFYLSVCLLPRTVLLIVSRQHTKGAVKKKRFWENISSRSPQTGDKARKTPAFKASHGPRILCGMWFWPCDPLSGVISWPLDDPCQPEKAFFYAFV